MIGQSTTHLKVKSSLQYPAGQLVTHSLVVSSEYLFSEEQFNTQAVPSSKYGLGQKDTHDIFTE